MSLKEKITCGWCSGTGFSGTEYTIGGTSTVKSCNLCCGTGWIYKPAPISEEQKEKVRDLNKDLQKSWKKYERTGDYHDFIGE